MNIVFFCHSLISDWNNGNAHFLRGLASELSLAGHRVEAFEPQHAWSVENLLADHGSLGLEKLQHHYPALRIRRYDAREFELEAAIDRADLVLVHEWNSPELIAAVSALRRRPNCRFRALFHDTHHRSVSDSNAIGGLALESFDGVLAFGEAVRERYLAAGWGRKVWTFHEAADTRVFRPLESPGQRADLVWIGNFGDDERTTELEEFVFRPARSLALRGTVYGVRYPEAGVAAVRRAGLEYAGYLPNYEVPRVFAQHLTTVHVPRRPYAQSLPGIPTIRVFEALACGIPLISAPWLDSERLFRDGDYLQVANGQQMQGALALLQNEPAAGQALARQGRETVLTRHTCRHRAEQLLAIASELGVSAQATTLAASIAK